MSDRTSVPQPGPGDDLENFPQATLPGDRWIYRMHAPWNGVWWFSSTRGGRFNLHDPRGTCYAADTVEAAVIETLGPGLRTRGLITGTDASKYQVTPIQTFDDRHVADFEASDAWKWKVSRELASADDYWIPQQWATALDEAGHDGIRYLSRFTTGTEAFAYALFGYAGAPDPEPPFDASNVVTGIAACLRAGIPVVGEDDLGELDVIEPDWPDP